jgi:hypothetical protein
VTISDMTEAPRLWIGAFCPSASFRVPERAPKLFRSFAEFVPNFTPLQRKKTIQAWGLLIVLGC